MTAEDLVNTETARAALAALREVTGEVGGAMERHCMRCFLLAERMAADRDLLVDHEVLLVAGLLHDIGLYDGASEGGVYVSDGRRFAARLLDGRPGWDERRTRLCLDAIERHHEVRSQWDAGAEVELIRRADLVELSSGAISLGSAAAGFAASGGPCPATASTARSAGWSPRRSASDRRRCRGS